MLVKKVGIVSTYNQQCGLATYSKYLTDALSSRPVTIFAEQITSSQMTYPDDQHVRRSWSRTSSDYSALESALKEEKIEILHLNCHQRFFRFPQFAKLLQSFRATGGKVLTALHNPYTVDSDLRELAQSSDMIVVHTPENRLEVIANGIEPSRVRIVEHGVAPSLSPTKDAARKSVGISSNAQAIVCFGFVQVHKGIDEVMQAFSELQKGDPDLHFYIVGGAHIEDQSSREYLTFLKSFAVQQGLTTNVHFIEGFIPEIVVDDYLRSADVIVMNYRSQYFEASGAVCKALASGNPVVTSTAPAFARLGAAVFHVTSGFPMNLALKLVLESKPLRNALQEESSRWCETFSWTKTAESFTELYSELSALPAHTSGLGESQSPCPVATQESRSRALRVLMKNRPNVYTNAGGDTVVMERTAQGLRELGLTVDIDIANANSPKDYDLVHLFNFATPEITEAHAKLCVAQSTPYVVTTMYEDLPIFYNQMAEAANALIEYINLGQPKAKWADLKRRIQHTMPSSRWENSYTAQHAAMLVATGECESSALLRDYPGARVNNYRCGCDIVDFADNGELFREQYKLGDFILCVGRLETRKNQLMLLKALEESTMTLVFATGGFTYQPDYEAACRAFKRAGKTIFLGKLDRRMLVSAYCAARIHALPSWYELPGLVSMEAARAGKNIVVCDRGTPRNYFGDKAFYCTPDDDQSINQAVMGAYYCPPLQGLAETVADCTWKNAALRYQDIYSQFLRNKSPNALGEVDYKECIIKKVGDIKVNSEQVIENVQNIQTHRLSLRQGEVSALAKELCAEGDDLATKYQIVDAREKYEAALTTAPEWSRPARSLGVLSLGEGKNFQAESWFDRALVCDVTDGKAWAGKGNALWELGRNEEALECYKEAIKQQPGEIAFLPLIVKAGYGLNRLAEITPLLENYVARYPSDEAIRYCLAGAYFKQGLLEKAREEAQLILQRSPGSVDAKQLLEVISANRAGRTWSTESSSLGKDTIQQLTSHWDEMLDQLENAKHDKDYDAVLERSRALLNNSSLRPDQRGRVLVLEGEALACRGQIAKARECFLSAENEPLVRSRALAGLGALALAEDKRLEAKSDFQEALRINEGNDVAKAGLAHCFAIEGRNDEAWRFYLEALESNPENLRAILGVIEFGYSRKALPQVEKSLRNYLSFHPADISILYSLAGCLFAQGRLDEAMLELKNILSLDPAHEMSRELLQEIEGRTQTNEHLGR